MHDQHTLDVSQFVLQKRPPLATLGTSDTSIKDSFRSPIQVKVRAASSLAAHEERQVHNAQ